MNNATQCYICRYMIENEILHIDGMPANLNKVYKYKCEAQSVPIGSLYIKYCDRCGFIFNSSFDINILDYSEGYDNNQNYSNFFNDYIEDEINWLIDNYINNESTVLEVGCGKGYYIKKVAEKLKNGRYYGLDTSYDGKLDYKNINLKYYREYFSSKFTYLKPDIVICRHVIEHISNPVDFLTSIRNGISDNALLFLETPDIRWIMHNRAYFDFFYEHCSYWSEGSITEALRQSGFEVIKHMTSFKGQYMWILAKPVLDDVKSHKLVNRDADIFTESMVFKEEYHNFKKKLTNRLRMYRVQDQRVAFWGAAAKSTTLMCLGDPYQELVSCLIDINPNKQNKYLGKTGHKIIAPTELHNWNIDTIVVPNPNYINEIKTQVYDKLGLCPRIITLDTFMADP